MPLGAHRTALMGIAGVSVGDMKLLSEQSVTAATYVEFANIFNTEYSEFIFHWHHINPGTDNVNFMMQVNASGETGYNETLTTTAWVRQVQESSGTDGPGYHSGHDMGQETGGQIIMTNLGYDSNQGGAGPIHFFNPGGAGFVKHFQSRSHFSEHGDWSGSLWISGYVNTTTALKDCFFNISSGNFDGTVKCWGVK